MGYTHYWSNSITIDSQQWRLICTEAHRLIADASLNGINLVAEFNEPESHPEINEAFIRFNGLGQEGHETFFLKRDATNFEFCKTARKPYDKVVGKLLWYTATIVPGFYPSNDDSVNYLTGKEYVEDNELRIVDIILS